MSSSSSPDRYTGVAIALHWLVALAVVGTFGLGLYMHDLPVSPSRLKLFNWHKWAGVTILAVGVLRVAWRWTHRPPADLPMPAWQRKLAHAVHGSLYVLLFAIPLVGWAYSSASGFPVTLFGVLPLPDFVPRDKALAEFLKPLHARLAWVLAALVFLHVAAVIKHVFVDKDALAARMLPRKATKVK